MPCVAQEFLPPLSAILYSVLYTLYSVRCSPVLSVSFCLFAFTGTRTGNPSVSAATNTPYYLHNTSYLLAYRTQRRIHSSAFFLVATSEELDCCLDVIAILPQ